MTSETSEIVINSVISRRKRRRGSGKKRRRKVKTHAWLETEKRKETEREINVRKE